MARSRNYIEEILEKKNRHLKRANRIEHFERRVIPLVEGFRYLIALNPKTSFRNEWLKYGAIGYVACIEGYFRMLYADLINHGSPYIDKVSAFKEIKLSLDDAVAIHSQKINIGEYVAHFLPISNIADINHCMSILLDEDFLKFYKTSPTSEWVSKPIGEVFPEDIGNVEELFKLRHLYAHELAPKTSVKSRQIGKYISSAAGFVWHTEELIQRHFLTEVESKKIKTEF